MGVFWTIVMWILLLAGVGSIGILLDRKQMARMSPSDRNGQVFTMFFCFIVGGSMWGCSHNAPKTAEKHTAEPKYSLRVIAQPEGARISVKGYGFYKKVTGSNKFGNLPEGDYTVTVFKDHFVQRVQEVHLDKNKMLTVKLKSVQQRNQEQKAQQRELQRQKAEASKADEAEAFEQELLKQQEAENGGPAPDEPDELDDLTPIELLSRVDDMCPEDGMELAETIDEMVDYGTSRGMNTSAVDMMRGMLHMKDLQEGYTCRELWVMLINAGTINNP